MIGFPYANANGLFRWKQLDSCQCSFILQENIDSEKRYHARSYLNLLYIQSSAISVEFYQCLSTLSCPEATCYQTNRNPVPLSRLRSTSSPFPTTSQYTTEESSIKLSSARQEAQRVYLSTAYLHILPLCDGTVYAQCLPGQAKPSGWNHIFGGYGCRKSELPSRNKRNN